MPEMEVGYLIKNINDRLKARADAELKHYHLTLTQSRVLAFLDHKGGRATQKEIELFLKVAHPTVVGIVSRLEQNGYVVSRMDGNDKRNKIVMMTKQAESLSTVMEHNILANEQRMLKSFSEKDVEHLKEMLLAIYQNLE